MNTSQRHTAVMVGLIVGAIGLFAGGGAAYYHLYVPRTETIWHAINRMDAADVKRHLRRDITQGFRYATPDQLVEWVGMDYFSWHHHWPVQFAVLHYWDWERERSRVLIRTLLEFGCEVDAAGEDDPTAFLLACRLDEVALMKLLLDAGADIDARMHELTWIPEGFARHPARRFMYNALHCAVVDGPSVDAVAFLLDRGLDPNENAAELNYRYWHEDPPPLLWTPLHTLMVSIEQHINGRGIGGDEPRANVRVARLLLEYGADVNARAMDEQTLLDMLINLRTICEQSSWATEHWRGVIDELHNLLRSHGAKTSEELGPHVPADTGISKSQEDAQP